MWPLSKNLKQAWEGRVFWYVREAHSRQRKRKVEAPRSGNESDWS